MANFEAIDRYAGTIDSSSPDTLSARLTSPFKAELDKVRSIFTWITLNISYNTGVFPGNRSYQLLNPVAGPLDTLAEWRSANEMTAMRVISRRTAVCDGYAKLFKTLCDYAGLQSEIVTGYARTNLVTQAKFRTNHSWNAVMIDRVWHLLDLTWASGYINMANEFVQRTDEQYFLTPPEQFATDHFPEDERWLLTHGLEPPQEFGKEPFRFKSFVKYSIRSHTPAEGMIDAAAGDTVRIELYVEDPAKDQQVTPDPFFDSTLFAYSNSAVFLSPSSEGKKYIYTCCIGPDTKWLTLMYNEDMILRYRVRIRKPGGLTPPVNITR
ncbi:MAG TPA: transglutaminase domain-containing protein [Flavisolibacter sp.]|nr:transglutaminase domain-containing protein [Flavisolibacter sp.]